MAIPEQIRIPAHTLHPVDDPETFKKFEAEIRRGLEGMWFCSSAVNSIIKQSDLIEAMWEDAKEQIRHGVKEVVIEFCWGKYI
jgi:hypothetical protein